MRVSKKTQFAKLVRVAMIAVISAAAVAGVNEIDAKRQHGNQVALSLRWARQMVTQAESLALSADASGEHDPVGWAAHLLSQGTDSRIIYVTKSQVPTPVTEPEVWDLDPSTGIFDYTKITDLPNGNGIRVRLYTTRTGIFGAKTLWQHDLSVAVLFVLFYGFLFFMVERKRSPEKKKAVKPPPPPVSTEPSLQSVVHAWAEESKASLTRLGGHIREILRGVQQVSKASRESKELLFALRLKIHAELEKIHTQVKDPGLTGLAMRVEAALARKKPLDAETQSLLKELIEEACSHAEALQNAEFAFEPIATDADMAFHALVTADKAVQSFTPEIKNITTGFLEQSHKIDELKKQGA